MNLFDSDTEEKDMHAVDYMLKTNRMLLDLFLRERSKRKLTKAALAEALGVNRSTVTRMLKGKANLTERTIGELLWALGYRLNQTPVRIIDGNERAVEAINFSYSNASESLQQVNQNRPSTDVGVSNYSSSELRTPFP